jgi:hypothetical protein
VAEVVPVDGGHQQLPAPQLVEIAGEALLVARPHPGQQVDVDRRADRGGQPEQRARAAGQLGEPRVEHGVHFRGQRVGIAGARPSRAQRLDDEERVSRRLGVEAVDVRVG